MHPEEAVRQLEYAIDASLDETGQRTAAGYRPTFERVADHADGSAVYALAGKLADEVVGVTGRRRLRRTRPRSACSTTGRTPTAERRADPRLFGGRRRSFPLKSDRSPNGRSATGGLPSTQRGGDRDPQNR